jgi:hypothetical protein
VLRQSVEAREVQWGREPLLVVQSAVFVCLQDENPGGNDVAREVNDEGNDALLEGVIYQEFGKIGAGEDRDLTACVFEVGGNGLFLMTFVLENEDVAKYGGACGGRDAENDVR